MLCAGNKGGNEKRFYKQMLPIADTEFTAHLTVVWKTDTENDNAEQLVLHDNGLLVMYSSTTVVWSVGNPPPQVDNMQPMITLSGSAQLFLNVGDSFIDPGATATDDVDGNVSANIVVAGSVNTTIYRTVTVQNLAGGDTPTAGNSLSADQDLNGGESLASTNGDYQLFMQNDGNLVLRDTATLSAMWSSGTSGTGAVKIKLQGDGNLVMRNAGGAAIWSTGTSGSGGDRFILNNNGSLVIYAGSSVVWSVGNPAPAADSTAPTIALNGSSSVEINQFDMYVDAGATANDNVDGDLSSNIVVTGAVNGNVIGSYTLNYAVTDSAGNVANTVSRTINVVDGGGFDTVPPIITLLGNAVVNINVGSSYTDAGVTANDNVDGNISNAIATSGAVDAFTSGSYTLVIIEYSC